MVVGALYGVAFPAINWSMAIIVQVLMDVAEYPPEDVREKLKLAMEGVAMGEFLVQTFADVLRAFGVDWTLLVICRIYFIGWSIVLALFFMSISPGICCGGGALDRWRWWLTCSCMVFCSLLNGLLGVDSLRSTIMSLNGDSVGVRDDYFRFTVVEMSSQIVLCATIALTAASASALQHAKRRRGKGGAAPSTTVDTSSSEDENSGTDTHRDDEPDASDTDVSVGSSTNLSVSEALAADVADVWIVV